MIITQDDLYDIAKQGNLDINNYDIDEMLIGFEEEKTEQDVDELNNADTNINILKIVLAHLNKDPKHYSKLLRNEIKEVLREVSLKQNIKEFNIKSIDETLDEVNIMYTTIKKLKNENKHLYNEINPIINNVNKIKKLFKKEALYLYNNKTLDEDLISDISINLKTLSEDILRTYNEIYKIIEINDNTKRSIKEFLNNKKKWNKTLKEIIKKQIKLFK